MVFVGAVYSGAAVRLGSDHAYALEVPESLLNCAEAVSLEEGVDAPPGQGGAGAE